VVGEGRPLPDRAEGPRPGDPRLHPRPGWAPDRGRPGDRTAQRAL